MHKFRQSIRLRLLLFFVLVTTLTLGGFGMLTRKQLAGDLEGQFIGLKESVASRLQVNMPAALWNFDIPVMGQIAASEIKAPEVRAIFVQDSVSHTLVGMVKGDDGQVLPSRAPEKVVGEEVRIPIFRVPLQDHSAVNAPLNPEGHVIVFFSREHIDAVLRANLRQLVLQILLVNGILVAFLALGLRLVFRPLARLRDAQLALAHQQSHEMTSLPPTHLTELDELSDGFNQTVFKLKQVIEMRTAAEAEAVTATLETRQVLDKLVAAQEELVKAGKLAALGRLVAGIAHELNTPIGTGLMAASAILDQFTSLKAELTDKGLRRSSLESFLHNAESGMDLTMRSLRRSAALVDRFKQISQSKDSAHFVSFNLHELLPLVITQMADALSAARCKVDYQPQAALELQSDPDLLGRVVSSILSNALVHAFEGRSDGNIKLFVDCDEDQHVVIHVQDDGVGIRPEHLPKVFDPFFSTKLGKGESGLGLYIANNIVADVLGGQLSLLSQVGVGTELFIRLPLVATLPQTPEFAAQ